MKRLNESPELLEELQLRPEDLRLPSQDVGALKERLLERVALSNSVMGAVPTVAPSAARWVMRQVLVAVAAGVAGWQGHAWWSGPAGGTENAPVSVVTVTPGEPVPVPSPVAPVRTAVAPTRPKVTEVMRSPLSLADQLRLYESGRTASQAGNHAAAVREFGRYVAEAPSGELWPEAAMGLLEAHAALAHWSDAEKLAGKLLLDGREGAQLKHLHATRAEARAKLGRCEDAEADVEAAFPALEERSQWRARVLEWCRR